MSQRKIFNFESLILIEKTLQEQGYHPDSLGRTSNKHIWAICRFCGEAMKIIKNNFNKSGSACHKKCKLEEQKIAGSPFKDKNVREKAAKTNLEKYGSEYASQSDIVRNKISTTKRTIESKEKVAKTNLEKYGVVNVFQSAEIKEKSKQTLMRKHGVDHPQKSPIIQETTKQTLINKYGADNLMRIPVFQEKARNEFDKTIADDEFGKHRLINTLRTEEFWQYLNGRNLSEVCEYFKLKYQSVATSLSNPEFKERFRQLYSYPKLQKQMEIKKFIEDMGFEVISNDKEIIGLELDIYIPEKKFAIEFNGSYWHSEAVLSISDARKKHIHKTKLCNANGVRLFHIFENTWEKKHLQIKTFLRSALGKNTKFINARDCEIDNQNASTFVNMNHMQRCPLAVERFFNLIYKCGIVGSMVVSCHHRQNASADAIVLSRLCFSDGVTVRGGASKLFDKFINWARNENYKQIISWSDSSWTEGNIYKVLGFSCEIEYNSDYFYWDMKNNTYVSKQSQKKKSTNCPDNMTEREWCLQRNLYRIWDCGKKLWIYKL